MPPAPGDLLLHYRLVDKIGEGGMGAVWRAVDTNLDREVAVKLMPDGFADDPERVARFDREAKLLASLSHPNIAAIHGFHPPSGNKEGVTFLVMELVDGEDLERRLARGPLPLDEALDVARQIAEALESAHGSGVVHRDLKPANIKLTSRGKVKVLDFGLAKAMTPEAAFGDSNSTHSPTLTSAGTRVGVILGTAAYMSPEQARGRAVDRRSDLWAFGAVLFEMITARQAFPGESVSDILAKILQGEPEWDLLPCDLPPAVTRVLRRCLTRDPANRLHDAADARIELQSAGDETAGEPEVVAAAPSWRRVLPWALCAALALWALVASIPRPEPPETSVAFDIAAPADHRFGEFTVSPDGTTIVFVASDREGTQTLWTRRLDSTTPEQLPGTEGARFPFWSPDSRAVAFFARGVLRRIDLASRSLQSVADAPNGRGGAWSTDDTILFAPEGEGALYAVPASGGGGPEAVTRLRDPETTHRFPHFIAGTRRFVFSAHSENSAESFRYLGSLDSDDTVKLLDGLSEAYTPPGHLVFVREGTLYAQPFDPVAARLSGDPAPLANEISDIFPRTARSAFSVSDNGVLAYLQQPPIDSRFRWFDRKGRALETITPPGRYHSATLSHDGKTMAFRPTAEMYQVQSILLLDLARGTASPLVEDRSTNLTPSWAHDDLSILYPTRSAILRLATGGGSPEVLLDLAETKEASSLQAMRHLDVAEDGSFVVFSAWDPVTDYDLWLLPLHGAGELRRLEAADRFQANAQVSPDSAWIAYDSSESGRVEVYVRSTDPSGRKWIVSTDGGSAPMWSDDGRELFYLSPQRELISVPIEHTPGGLVVGLPRALFAAPEAGTSDSVDGYDSLGAPNLIAVDGDRFLFQVPVAALPARAITVVLGWERFFER